ncbi:MAG TPA: phosphate ABC transporter ATP-binding protein [Miltoncostaeaceae bacterium]|nr:phosphate ABC transporter ATP-binding protein [Miltoncostaeaceae bacterium]
MPRTPPLFTFDAVEVVAPHGPVLRGVDLEVPDGGVTVVLGPSGSGKSTLLRLCNRLEAPSAGTVRFRGADLAGVDPLAHRRRVGMVFQQPTPFGGTVRDNLRVAAPDAGEGAMAAALGRARLAAGFLDRQASELSGGESQRACLARTLMAGPEVLLMDEPTSALDEAARSGLERLARELCDAGVPVLWVTHDLAQAARIADAVVRMDDGRVVSYAPATGRGPG